MNKLMATDILHNIDCRTALKQLQDESIDCVVSDVPYRIVGSGCSADTYKDSNGHSQPSGTLNKQRVKTKVERNAHGHQYINGTKHISLGGLLDDVADNVRAGKLFQHNDIDFVEYLPELYRVLKKGTHCYLMINARNLKDLQLAAEDAGFAFQNLLVWDKSNSGGTPNKYYMQKLEFILMLSKRPARNINEMGTPNLLSVPNILCKGEHNHPTQKPIELMKVFIRNSTNKGDIVLDPFAGSGSTLIAAKQLERHYIGYEIDEKYYNMAMKRLSHEPTQRDLFSM